MGLLMQGNKVEGSICMGVMLIQGPVVDGILVLVEGVLCNGG